MSLEFDLDAMTHAQEEAMKLQQQMMQQMYGNNPEMLAMIQQQMAAAQGGMQDMAQQQMAAAQSLSEKVSADPMSFLQGFMEEDEAFESLEDALAAVDELEEKPAVSVARGSAEAKEFGILLSGVVSTLNGHELDQLEVEEKEPFFIEKVKGILCDGWGLETREELLSTLTYLTEGGGHTARYAAYCTAPSYEALLKPDMDADDRASAAYGWEFAQNEKGTHSAEELLGWDYGRAAMLARWGYFLDMLSREECEAFLEKCALAMSGQFASWREFGKSYLFGGCFWSSLRGGDEEIADYYAEVYPALAELLDAEEGPWACNPWVKGLS